MSDPAPTESPRMSLRDRLLRFAMRGGALVLAGIAILVCGIAMGWVAATATVVASSENRDPQVVQVPLSAVSDDVLMPDVRGLDPDSAMQVLADAGVDIAAVRTTDRPAAGESGVVIEQVPAFGASRPAEVVLVVSAPATMPSLVGQNADEAMVTLRELSARVDTVGVYRPGEVVGLIVSTDPAFGEIMPPGVTLIVTEAPSSVDFAALSSVGSCDPAESLQINGKQLATGVSCSGSTSGRTNTWELGGALEVISGTIGITDGSSPGTAVRIDIVADGAVLGSFDLTSGISRQFEFNVSEVQSLVVTVTTLSSGSPTVGIGDFFGLGTAEKINGLPR